MTTLEPAHAAKEKLLNYLEVSLFRDTLCLHAFVYEIIRVGPVV
jgi:hypothetical protein